MLSNNSNSIPNPCFLRQVFACKFLEVRYYEDFIFILYTFNDISKNIIFPISEFVYVFAF
jgi:hypothetical protein